MTLNLQTQRAELTSDYYAADRSNAGNAHAVGGVYLDDEFAKH
jgi:hypothetical protein